MVTLICILLGMAKSKGKIIIEPDLNIWPHELKTAEALANAGYTVKFIRKSEADHEKTPDVLIDGEPWEMKAPNGSLMKRVEKNLRRELAQSSNIVFDSRRLKNIPDLAIERELRICTYDRVKKLKHLIFVNRKGNVMTSNDACK